MSDSTKVLVFDGWRFNEQPLHMMPLSERFFQVVTVRVIFKETLRANSRFLCYVCITNNGNRHYQNISQRKFFKVSETIFLFLFFPIVWLFLQNKESVHLHCKSSFIKDNPSCASLNNHFPSHWHKVAAMLHWAHNVFVVCKN